MKTNENGLRLRSNLTSSSTDDEDNEAQSGAPITTDDNVDRLHSGSSRNDGGVDDPVEIPASTHSLLFTQPVRSLPFAYAVGVALLSLCSLALVSWNSMGLTKEKRENFDLSSNVPVNVSNSVRMAQYLSIIIVLLMEEEIPTGLYLLRMIPRGKFQQQFPDLKYSKFVLSSIVRILMGYFFLFNVFIVIVQSTMVIEIFYNVLALQFVQQFDDIVFMLAKMDVHGKGMQRACTAKCFQTTFERQASGRSKKLKIFLQGAYFFNFVILLVPMAVVSVKQMNGGFFAGSITVDLGNAVWEDVFVDMPPEFYDKWTDLYPYFKKEKGSTGTWKPRTWTLAFSMFNGVYEREGVRHGYPIYKEMRKSDDSDYKTIVPAQISYCNGISAWVFTHTHIRKSDKADESGCNWLLRSEETTEYDLFKVGMNWKIWNGVIGTTEISYVDNKCTYEADCNFHGGCIDGKCVCNSEVQGVKYLGSHCETEFKEECKTVDSVWVFDGEKYNLSFSAKSVGGNKPGPLQQQYSRPVYFLDDEEVEEYDDPEVVDHEDADFYEDEEEDELNQCWACDCHEIGEEECVFDNVTDCCGERCTPHCADGDDDEDYEVLLIFAGSRWFITIIESSLASVFLASMKEFHAFWGRIYDQKHTNYISDESKEGTPVGVNFYYIHNHDTQYGPFGLLRPMNSYVWKGVGFFHCAEHLPSPENDVSLQDMTGSKIYRGRGV